MITIRPIQAQDRPRWLTLWNEYLDFYATKLDPAITEYTWQRILNPQHPMQAIVADHDKLGVIGFANYLLHDNTWSARSVCYLEDLFVDASVRGQRTGEQLIDWLVAEMKIQNWARLYWHTSETNYRARGLYDKYTRHSGSLRYMLSNDTIS